jgi:hypothetical protein
MAIPARIYDISTTAASNSPAGSDNIGTTLDDYLRGIQAVVRLDLASKGADIASATTTDIAGTSGFYNDVTGTTTVTGLGTVAAGVHKVIKFEGALVLTHNATSLILPGATNITTADGDVAWFISEGSGNWRCLSYMKANGSHLGPVLGTEQASTSGTTIDFTIPSWAKKITVQFVGVSTSGTNSLLVQIGDSGGVEDTGYLSATSGLDTGVTSANSTAGFIVAAVSAGSVLHGSVVLTLEDASNFTWVSAGTLAFSSSAATSVSAGSKSLSAALTTVRVTTAGGSDTFDAGAINVIYE